MSKAQAETVEDTSVSEAPEVKDDIDLSPETEEQDTDPMAELEDSEINFEDDGEDTDVDEVDESDDESDEVEESIVEAPTEDEPEAEEADEAEDDEGVEGEVEEESTASEAQPEDESQKVVAHEAFKRREAERQLRERDEAEEKRNLDRYLKEAEDDDVEHAKRQTEVERHLITRERISLNEEKLSTAIENFSKNSPLLKTNDEAIKEEFGDAIESFIAKFVTTDNKGKPLEIRVDPATGKQADVYQYLQKKASSIEKLTGIGARTQTKQKAKEKARTVIRPTRTPKEPARDSDLDTFDEEFYR